MKFGYNRSVYADDQIGRVAAQLRSVLEQMAAQPESEIGALNAGHARGGAARAGNLQRHRDTRAATTATLLDLLDEAAEKNPEGVAVVQADISLTYRELHARANGLAAELQRRGVGPETLVGLMVDRSVDMIVAVLGVWKAGAAYVPFDPDYPAERLAFMVSDARPRVIVTQRKLRRANCRGRRLF